jgi:diadenosine tetraphosphate (Ap4A) HIT family hydrolase
LVLGLWNAYPVTPGHALLVTRRHVADWFAATEAEQGELMAAVAGARACIEERHRPDGYNLGLNCGEAAGQTVFHLHLHVLPRYAGVRPTSGRETSQLIPGSLTSHLKISNILETLRERLQIAISFDFCSGSDLLLIFSEVEGFLRRGGHLRALVAGNEGLELARRFPGQVELYRAAVLPCDYFRVRSPDQEWAWMGGPLWHYEVTGRDGQREVRRAFEAMLTQPVGE